ncbi:MAG TPA: class I SAM-dependent methyltransferase [Thermoleophilaceae bacterium]|nr:class I SAM-dependent methyltransferase [Thermoleophilaceae bacterium]
MPDRRAPDPFQDAFTGLIAARAVTTAVMLGVFEALHERPSSRPELAERLGLDSLGVDTLVTALATLGYLEDAGHGRVGNAPTTERLLVRSSPESIATFVGAQADLHWEVLDILPDAVRSGRAYAMHEDRRGDRARWEAYIQGLFEISRAEHDENASRIPVENPRRLVDVAGGHAAFSMAMCRRHPDLEATVIDLPPSVAVGRRIVAEQGYADRVSFREGDVFEVGLGEEIDVVSVFNLVHHLPEERDRDLCRMARDALRPGGFLVIGDSARPEPDEAVSEHGAISSVLFYAWSHGRNFAPSEIRGWVEDAGLEEVRVHRNERSPWRVVVVGRRG